MWSYLFPEKYLFFPREENLSSSERPNFIYHRIFIPKVLSRICRPSRTVSYKQLVRYVNVNWDSGRAEKCSHTFQIKERRPSRKRLKEQSNVQQFSNYRKKGQIKKIAKDAFLKKEEKKIKHKEVIMKELNLII